MAGPMAANPDELLQQIRALLDEYLAMGGGTPVEAEAQALAQAIDASAGAGPEMGGEVPPDMGALPPEAGAEPQVPPENQMGGGDLLLDEPPPNPGAKTYEEANVSALDRLKKRNKSRA